MALTWKGSLKEEIKFAFDRIQEIEELLRTPISQDTKRHLESELEIYKRNHSFYRQILEEENAKKFMKRLKS